MLSGRRRRFTDLEGAETFLAEHAGTPVLALVESQALAADAPTVHARLTDKVHRAKADEVFILATGPSLDARIRSLELIENVHRSAA